MPQFDFYIINSVVFYLLLSYTFVFSILSYYLFANYERLVKLKESLDLFKTAIAIHSGCQEAIKIEK